MSEFYDKLETRVPEQREAEQFAVGWRVALRVGHLAGQRGELLGLALLRHAGFQLVVELTHGCSDL
jgi:hypothetical protein